MPVAAESFTMKRRGRKKKARGGGCAKWSSSPLGIRSGVLPFPVPPAASAISEGENLLVMAQLAIHSSVGGVDPALRRRDASAAKRRADGSGERCKLPTTRFQDAKACEMSSLGWVHLRLSCSVAPVKTARVVRPVLGNDSCRRLE